MAVNEKKLFNLLLKQYGFYIDEYEFEGKKKWIALKDTDGGLYAVITSDEEECNKCYYHAEQFLKSKNVSFSLNNVIFTKSNKQVQTDDYNKLIFNTKENSVIYCSSASDVLSRIINMMTNNEKSRLPLALNVTNILILINIIMFVVSCFLSHSIIDINTYVLVAMGAKVDSYIWSGEIYRLVTAMFLHGGLIHIFFNMYALYSLGYIIEDVFGKKQYMIIYFLSGICSNLLSAVISPYVSVGASGAIFGLFGAAAVFGFMEKYKIGKSFFYNMASLIFVNIIIGFSQPNIDNAAHFGGLACGVILSYIILRKRAKV